MTAQLDDVTWGRFAAGEIAATDLPEPWVRAFAPLGFPSDSLVIGQLGTSLDGRVATVTGHSLYINGDQALVHVHRLRALVDAVVVGVGTVVADNPRLTVRRCSGRHPVRIVIDPNGRIPTDSNVLAENGVRRLVITGRHVTPLLPTGVEHLALPMRDGVIDPVDILAALAEDGMTRLLIEGGAATIGRFLQAGCLDRLHVMVAPLLIGSGRLAFDLPEIQTLDQACRMPTAITLLGADVLFDCALDRRAYPASASTSK